MKTKFKNAKGITLIALVITIIVLLILAGVTIATLTGDNGILTQAGKAKDKTTEAESIERVQVEVAGSYGIDGTIDKEQLNKNLKNINGLIYNGNALSDSNKIANLPATVTLNGYDIVINANGGVEKIPEIIAKIRANPQAYYGKKVTNYKASDSDTNTYRIFYVDKDNDFKDGYNTIYLKADFSSTSYKLNDYASYDSVNTKIRTMNPDWAKGKKSDSDIKTRGESEFEDPNAETKKVIWNINEQAAAYLCSPVNETNKGTTSLPWKGYYNSEYAKYVIGGPSVEMYVKSYNQTHGDDALGCQYQTNYAPGYIYKVNNTIQDGGWETNKYTLDYSMTYKSMYCGQNGRHTEWWWLASPSANRSNGVCYVNGNFAYLSYGNYGNSIGVSPLVSLKSSFIPEVEE